MDVSEIRTASIFRAEASNRLPLVGFFLRLFFGSGDRGGTCRFTSALLESHALEHRPVRINTDFYRSSLGSSLAVFRMVSRS
jgi:hypothetical protein